MSQKFSTPPPGVGIQVVKSMDSQVVISVPPGGKKARSLGCFGFVWLAITAGVTGGFLFAENVEVKGDPPPLIFLILFFGLFWAVGLGMVFIWARMRFTQLLVSVQPDQFAIQKTLFGRKKISKFKLDEDSSAELAESYRENEQPVYTVKMQGVDGSEKFATGLSYEEKRWLTRTINQFLGVDRRSTSSDSSGSLPNYCGDCGTELMLGDGKRICPDCDRVYLEGSGDEQESSFDDDMTDPMGGSTKIIERPAALDPYELPPDSKIRIDLDDGATLAFSYRIDVPRVAKVIGGVFLTFFCTIWYGVVGTAFVAFIGGDEPIGMKLGLTAFLSLFVLAGLMPLGALLSLFFGRASIRMTSEKVTGAIGVLFLKKKKSISTESISDVGLAKTMVISRNSRRGDVRHSTRTPGPFSSQKGAMIESSKFNMPLSMSSDAQFNEQIAGLVRFQLERSGVRLPNA